MVSSDSVGPTDEPADSGAESIVETLPTDRIFRLPDLGEGLTEAEIVSWHVGAGDRVVTGQPLVSVETDKAVVEVPAPAPGIIAQLHGEVGARVPVGAPLVSFADSAPASTGVVGELAEASPANEADAAEPEALPGGAAASDAAAGSAPENGAGGGAGAGAGAGADQPASSRPANSRSEAILATPVARQLAREAAIDLATVTASGPDGVIRTTDVQAAGESATRPAGADATITLHGPRRAMAERMADAHRRVVPATVTGSADITRWPEGTRPLSRLIRAIGMAVHAEPALNAWFDDSRMTLQRHPQVDLGIAMETADGLFVPVLRNIGSRTTADLDAELAELKTAVVARTIAPDRLRGQTITLSNFGAVAGWHATMVVVPPQVAIIGAGRAESRVGIDRAGFSVHRILPLSLTIDHRVLTGVEACRFLAALVEDLECP